MNIWESSNPQLMVLLSTGFAHMQSPHSWPSKIIVRLLDAAKIISRRGCNTWWQSSRLIKILLGEWTDTSWICVWTTDSGASSIETLFCYSGEASEFQLPGPCSLTHLKQRPRPILPGLLLYYFPGKCGTTPFLSLIIVSIQSVLHIQHLCLPHIPDILRSVSKVFDLFFPT